MKEKRRFPRFEATCQIRYSPEGKSPVIGYSISNDMSVNGLGMPASSGVINKGDIVKISIENVKGASRIFATGKVKWIKPRSRVAPLDEEVGIEFTDIHSADIKDLLNPPR